MEKAVRLLEVSISGLVADNDPDHPRQRAVTLSSVSISCTGRRMTAPRLRGARSNAPFRPFANHFRSTLIKGRRQTGPVDPLDADCVEKLENRAAPKISQMQRIDDFSRCNAL
jgi:hypothetical protein